MSSRSEKIVIHISEHEHSRRGENGGRTKASLEFALNSKSKLPYSNFQPERDEEVMEGGFWGRGGGEGYEKRLFTAATCNEGCFTLLTITF